MSCYKDVDTRTLQATLNDGVEDLLRKIDPLPTLSGNNEKGWDVHYHEKAQRFLDEMNGLLKPLLNMARELKELERYLVEFWKEEHISAQKMPKLAQLMDQTASFVTQTVKSLVDKKQEKKIQQVAAQIQELKELLCWLTYTGQTDETYEKLYQAKMRATRSKERSPRLNKLLMVRVPSQNPIFIDEVTYSLSGLKLYRQIFTGDYEKIDLDHYFQYECIEEEESTTPVQLVSVGKEVELVQKTVQQVQKNVQDPLLIQNLGSEYNGYYQLTLEWIARCEIRLEEGYTGAWVNNCLTALFGSKCAEKLKLAFENAKAKKVVSMMVGRLITCGIYIDESNDTFAKLLNIWSKPSTIGRYIGLGRKRENDRYYVFLEWIEDYCNTHRPTTSA